MSEYQLFNMCPFSVASIGGGGSFLGVGSESYTWTHFHCLKSNCRLWVYKVDEKGEIFAEGCSLQFVGLNKNEISKNQEIKNKKIEETEDVIINKNKKCPRCEKTYDNNRKYCFDCHIELK
ncbi:MAG: hypothetical protein KJ915_12015 [Candidatus Omnitrophica bacterium]|nr:hypothetical protein [Candidatus Omnitrophota bacterium]